MSLHTRHELNRLTEALVRQTSRVRDHLGQACACLLAANSRDPRNWADSDDEIDREEVAIEEECLRQIALHQPMGTDLRCLIAYLKANNDMERIADHGTNIALALKWLPPGPELPDTLPLLVRRVIEGCDKVFDALFEANLVGARAVIEGDDVIDSLENAISHEARRLVGTGALGLDAAFALVRVAHDLERIGDLSKNIAEDIVFMVQGEIVRHRLRPDG